MFRRLAVLLSALLVVGCGPAIQVTHDIDEPVDKPLRTYAFLKDSADMSAEQIRVNRLIKDILRDKLNEMGYQQVSSKPDFIVGEFAASVFSLEDVEVVDDVDDRLRQRELLAGDSMERLVADNMVNFDDARAMGRKTLLVFMTDPSTGTVFWRSRAEAELSFEEQGLAKIDEAVDLIMEDFPERSDDN